MPNSTRKWHRNSIFGDGPRVRLDREQRAQWKAKLQLQRRPGRLTIGTADVGRALCNMLGNDGRLDPSHATIAIRSGVHISTVKRALEQLAEFGFLSWTRRLIRRAWRCEQTTSAYVLMTPRAAPSFNAPSLNQIKKTCSLKMNVAGEGSAVEVLVGLDVAAARAALSRRRLAVEAALMAGGASATRFLAVPSVPPRPRG